ncbi:MAG: protein kinase domain-containing protein [Thermoguttaceae bacterium]
MKSSCSIELLESALAGELPPEREEILHRHLDECEACFAALEQMAGGEAECRKAAALLTSDELDQDVPSREEWSDVDFMVDHLEPAEEPGVLGRLGGYDVLEIIGRGGMGVVLKGFDPELKRCVAIKVLSPHLAQSSLAKKRFAREAQAAAAVVHPNVLAIHQVQPSGRLPFLVMPLVTGESLAQRLTAEGRLELKEVLRIGMQAAAGLAAAHEQGLVHRDVKPANILLEKGVERAVLTDFGLARAADDVSMTRWGVIAGTPQYMSPEQARGEPLDGRSDLFSLGCVLYEMATGVSPFRADSTVATLRRLIDDTPPAMASLNAELPPWFVGIVERLLEKDPARRFGSAKEVSDLLEGCLAHLQQPTSVPVPAVLPAPAPRGVSRLRKTLIKGTTRKTLIKGTIAMITTLGIALLGMLAMQSTDPPDIVGKWQGEGWGQVMLKQTAPGQYAGTYTETEGEGPGKIELKWSRIERCYNGTWSEGEDRFGDLSIRLADQEIRGTLTTDSRSRVNPATPRLANLVWNRVESAQSAEAASAVSWGDWYAGWSMRLRATKATWTRDELPEFSIDLRKREAGEPDAVRQTLHNWLLEVDGRRFRLAIFTTSREHKQVFEPGVARLGFLTFRFHRDESGLDIQTGEGGTWINSYRLDPVGKDGQVLSHPKPDERFQWTPGKHLVRVAFPMMPKPPARYTESDLASFVMSNRVEVQIQEKAEKPVDVRDPETTEKAHGNSTPSKQAAPNAGQMPDPNANHAAEIGEASTDTTKHDDPPKATKHLPLVRVFDYMLSHYSNTTINNKRIEKELIGQVYSDIVRVEDVKEFELEHDPDQYLYVEARLPENKYNGCKVGLIFDKKSTKAEVYKAAAELTKGAKISIAAKLYKLIFSAASNDEAALGTLASKNEARFTGVEWLEIISDQRG